MEAKDAAKYLTIQRTFPPPTKNYLALQSVMPSMGNYVVNGNYTKSILKGKDFTILSMKATQRNQYFINIIVIA